MSKKNQLNIFEFGRENHKIIVLIHPSLVRWDYFERVIPLLEKGYHLVIPVLPGYDFTADSDFTSVEEVARQIAVCLKEKQITQVETVYGCSLGGSIALRMAVDGRIKIGNIIMDGGITPYQLPWLITRLILIRDFLMIALGKLGGEKILVHAFTSDQYSQEDMNYIAKVLNHVSYKTIWRTFDSCNNYKLPKKRISPEANVYYWFGENEQKQRDWDIKYMKKRIPKTEFMRIKGMDHGGLPLLRPREFAKAIKRISRKNAPGNC